MEMESVISSTRIRLAMTMVMGLLILKMIIQIILQDGKIVVMVNMAD